MSSCATSFISPPSIAHPNGSGSTSLCMSIFDDLQLIFSDEGKKNRAEYDARIIAEQEEAQKQIMERRRNPEKMRLYEDQRATERKELNDERNLWKFQQKSEEGYDPLTDWNRLRKEGKIKVGSDLERDPTTSRFGSEGLVEVRVDERMPYIDQGYVDEDADVIGNFMNIFGGKKKDKKN